MRSTRAASCGLIIGLTIAVAEVQAQRFYHHEPLAGSAVGPSLGEVVVRDNPGPRSSHALVYDERRRRVVLLDGYPWPGAPVTSRRPALTEVWSWDGARWASSPGSGPTARYVGAAVYDIGRARIVSHGGRVGDSEDVKGDTWEWDGSAWRSAIDTGVDARAHHAMAYDAARGKTVMFGGDVFPARPGAWSADTWTWDGSTWARAATEGPVGRISTMVYDSKREQVVLFGGVGQSPAPGRSQPFYSDTWVWNGSRWRKAADSGPPARQFHAMTFDRRAGVVLLYGGSARAAGTVEVFEDMWQWDGERWTEIKMSGPTPGKRVTAMVYDVARDRTVLYGGTRPAGGKLEFLTDTWEWDGTRWSKIE